MGRLISAADDAPGAPVVADISYGTWRSVFGGDPNIVGHETQLDGKKCTIIGVMPQGFQFPPGEEDPAQMWSPLQIDPANPGGRSSHNYYLLGRLKPGVSAAQAQGETGRASAVRRGTPCAENAQLRSEEPHAGELIRCRRKWCRACGRRC